MTVKVVLLLMGCGPRHWQRLTWQRLTRLLQGTGMLQWGGASCALGRVVACCSASILLGLQYSMAADVTR